METKTKHSLDRVRDQSYQRLAHLGHVQGLDVTIQLPSRVAGKRPDSYDHKASAVHVLELVRAMTTLAAVWGARRAVPYVGLETSATALMLMLSLLHEGAGWDDHGAADAAAVLDGAGAQVRCVLVSVEDCLSLRPFADADDHSVVAAAVVHTRRRLNRHPMGTPNSAPFVLC